MQNVMIQIEELTNDVLCNPENGGRVREELSKMQLNGAKVREVLAVAQNHRQENVQSAALLVLLNNMTASPGIADMARFQLGAVVNAAAPFVIHFVVFFQLFL